MGKSIQYVPSEGDIFYLEEEIRNCYLRSGCNLLATHRDLLSRGRQLTVEEVQKVTDKFKEESSKDVKLLIADRIMMQLLMGQETRKLIYQEMLEELRGREQLMVSLCCTVPVKKEADKTYTCLQCRKVTNVKMIDRVEIYEVKQNVLLQMLEEDKHLLASAKEMGFTKRIEPSPTVLKQTNINVISTGDTNINANTMKKLEDMGPNERLDLKNQLLADLEREKKAHAQDGEITLKPEE